MKNGRIQAPVVEPQNHNDSKQIRLLRDEFDLERNRLYNQNEQLVKQWEDALAYVDSVQIELNRQIDECAKQRELLHQYELQMFNSIIISKNSLLIVFIFVVLLSSAYFYRY